MRKLKYAVKTREQILKQRIIIYTIIIIVIAVSGYFSIKTYKELKQEQSLLATQKVEVEVKENQKLKLEENENIIDISSILQKNTNKSSKKTLNVDEVDLDYTTEYIQNDELPTGTIQVQQEGIDGKQKVIVIKTYEGTEYIEEEKIPGEVITEAVNKIVQIGTGEGTNNYTPKEGDSLWATPEKVQLREFPNNKANSISEITKETKVSVMEVVNDNWLKIQVETLIGYVDSACFTNINPNGEVTQVDFQSGVEYTRDELLASLDFDMDLSKPSGLTIDQFKKILTGNSADKANVLADSAEYFYYAEKQYGINGVYLAAMAIHEGGWGTSKIATDKKNLFGYGAYDSDPYNGAKSFENYGEGIDLVARVLVKTYLHPAGTEIYDGQIAQGTYYNGPTLTGVNTRYASDKNWANAVFKWMTYLYNRL